MRITGNRLTEDELSFSAGYHDRAEGKAMNPDGIAIPTMYELGWQAMDTEIRSYEIPERAEARARKGGE